MKPKHDPRLAILAEMVRQGVPAFDSEEFESDVAAFRAACREVIPMAVRAGMEKQRDKRRGQGSLFE